MVVTEYSLSPEVKFPVANEQTYAALCWIHENGISINLNPDKICIAGDSAGGNMATVVASKNTIYGYIYHIFTTLNL